MLKEDIMAEIIGVRFKEVGKVYYFDPIGNKLNVGDKVIVETTRGVECGTVALQNKEVSDDNIVHPLKQIIRIASKEDNFYIGHHLQHLRDLYEYPRDIKYNTK